MAGVAEERRLGDIANFRNGKGLKKSLQDEAGTYPVLGGNGVISRTDETLNADPVVVIGRVGVNCGSVHYVDEPSWVTDNAISATPKEGVDLRFLYYRLHSLDLQRTSIGSAQPLITQSGLSVMKTRVPPLPEQRAIASILGALDDKIELNRRMNATLESLARAIFKSWFVDFDPVKINAGQIPASSRALATHDPKVLDLFPSTFQDSPLGPMPEGWRIERWRDIATLEYGKSLKGYRESGGHIRVWGTNGPIGWHTAPLCESEGIIIGRKGAYRGVHYSPEPFFVIDTAFYLKPICDFDLMWAYYELLRLDINGMDSGSAIPSTSREDFYSIPIRVPPMEVLSKFGEVLEAGLAQRYANDRESEILGRKRDTLLPELLSGELPVPTAVTETEDATADAHLVMGNAHVG